LRKGP
jgi:hypothetical protein